MEISSIEKEVKSKVIEGLVKRMSDIVEPIIFPKNVGRIDDTDDNECFDFKPYILYLEQDELQDIEVKIIYSYYDNVFYDSLNLPKNSVYRKGDTIRGNLSFFNIVDLVNIIYKIPKRYNIDFSELFDGIEFQINKHIKENLSKIGNLFSLSEDCSNSVIVSSMTYLEVNSFQLKDDEVYIVHRRVREDEIKADEDYEGIVWTEWKLKDFDFSEIVSIAELFQKNLKSY